jgi:HEAT repeat protein
VKHLKARIRIAGPCLLLALAGLLVLVLGSRQEPLYESRRLSDWIIELRYGAPFTKDHLTGIYSEQTQAKAAEAIMAIGDKGIPFYLKWITDEPSELKKSLTAFLLKHPSIPTPISFYRDPSAARAEAVVSAFFEIGTNGTGAVPELTALLSTTQSRTVRQRAALVLGTIGPAGAPPLKKAAAHPNPEMRLAAVRAMYRPWSDLYLNTLFERISDADPQVSAAASRNLVLYCYRTESHFRLLTNALTHPNPQIRTMAVTALERYGGNYLPLIQTLSGDTNEEVHKAVLDAAFRLRYE